MSMFDTNGRRYADNYRVFGKSPVGAHSPSFYYKLENTTVDFEKILENSKSFLGIDKNLNVKDFRSKCENLTEKIKRNTQINNILNGVCIPFLCKLDSFSDLGSYFENNFLPAINKSFINLFPDAHFKAVLQGDTKLEKHIKIDPDSNYQEFINAAQKDVVVGLFFPQATQEFDVQSQREQMREFTPQNNICLSGGFDTVAALVGKPDLLMSQNFYTPILCMSSFLHIDPRLVLLIKAYGPHLEFWLMTQMLTKDITQVSEQWTCGITVFDNL